MNTTSLIVDFHFVRCGNCKVMVDGLTTRCPACDAVVDRIVSNHVGLADKLLKKRREAGVQFEAIVANDEPVAAGQQPAKANGDAASHVPDETFPIVADFYTQRCGNCKSMLEDVDIEECPVCDVVLDRIVSNHAGLAAKIQKERAAAAVT